MADKTPRGLADVVAASTAVSDIDGRAGPLHGGANEQVMRTDSEYIGERGLTWVPVGQR